ncbi:MAG: SCP2 sterol-binding domain-containing protein [Actinomycetota bacterium]
MAIDISSPTAIKDSVAGKSDEQILEDAKGSGGAKGVLDQMFEGMVTAFKPEAAAGKTAVLAYEITTPEEAHSYALKVDNGTCELHKGPVESARITMVMAFPDWLRLAAGELDGMKAFMSGKLKIRGDMMFAQQMATWFEQPA